MVICYLKLLELSVLPKKKRQIQEELIDCIRLLLEREWLKAYLKMINTGRILQHKNKGFIIPVNYLPRISLRSYFINEEINLQG